MKKFEVGKTSWKTGGREVVKKLELGSCELDAGNWE